MGSYVFVLAKGKTMGDVDPQGYNDLVKARIHIIPTWGRKNDELTRCMSLCGRGSVHKPQEWQVLSDGLKIRNWWVCGLCAVKMNRLNFHKHSVDDTYRALHPLKGRIRMPSVSNLASLAQQYDNHVAMAENIKQQIIKALGNGSAPSGVLSPFSTTIASTSATPFTTTIITKNIKFKPVKRPNGRTDKIRSAIEKNFKVGVRFTNEALYRALNAKTVREKKLTGITFASMARKKDMVKRVAKGVYQRIASKGGK